MKKLLVFLLSVLVLLSFVISQEAAQETAANVEQEQPVPEFSPEPSPTPSLETSPETEARVAEEEKPELRVDAGITPDSPLYFIDDLAERVLVGDNPERALDYKEEKIAEAREMIEKDKPEEAREVLERALNYGDIVKEEVSPEIKDRTKESSEAIQNVLEEMEEEVEGEEWEEVKENFEEVKKKEKEIMTSAEVASKIKELCETLSKLDPLEYSRVCKTKEDDDAPRWKRKLDRELTKEQEKEAKEFFGIMSNCFKNPKQCECYKIKVPGFAEKCSEIAPLAAKCQEGNEEACEKIDKAEDAIDLLPDYLQEVLAGLERKYGEDKMDLHMPSECRKAGATDRRSCMRVMFKLHAPEECVEALERGEINPQNEIEARKACDEIMFKANAPPECVEAGARSPKECGKLMFKLNAPQECIDAGLTGEVRSDEKKCREIMGEIMEKGRGERRGRRTGGNCREIQNAEERLRCYDSASQDMGEEFERHERGGPPGGWPQQCIEANTLTRESCERTMMEFGERRREEDMRGREEERREYPEYRPEPMPEPIPPGEVPPEQILPSPEPMPEQPIPTPEPTPIQEPTPTPEPAPSPEPTPTPEPSPTTGAIISIDNSFLNHWFKR